MGSFGVRSLTVAARVRSLTVAVPGLLAAVLWVKSRGRTGPVAWKAFTAWLDQELSVDKTRKIGTMGYCMGGPLVMRTAAANPERVGAGASFHGGGLVTDKPDSPHLLIPKMKARLLIAIAANDDAKQPEVKDKLKAAFTQASLTASVEVFEGTKHGWCPPDSQVYDATAAEKAWSELVALFTTAMK